MEPNLRSPEAWFQLLVAVIEDYAIYMLDPDGIVVTWNRGAEQIKGYVGAEVVGQHFSLFYTAEDQARDHPGFELEQARIHGHFVEEGWRVRKDGSTFWARVTLTSLRDASGELIGYGKVTHDLTDRRDAADELEASEQRMRMLIEGSSDGFLLRDHKNRRLLYANQTICRITGKTVEELSVGRPALEAFVEPADFDRFDSKLNDPGPWELEVRSRPNPEVRVMRIRSIDLSDEGHGWSALVIEDITERQRRERALVDSEERFTQLLGALTDAFVVLDVEPLAVLYCSPNVVKVLGTTSAGLLGGQFRDSIHPDDLDTVVAAWKGATAAGYELEFRIIRPDASVAWIRLRRWPMRIEDGRATRFGSVYEDITERKFAAAELSAARLAAERANAAKNDFLSRMSHELRTPLNAVLGFAQLMRSDGLSDLQSEAIDHILRSGDHLLNLINDILDISRIENGRLELSTEPVAVEDVVSEAVRLVGSLAVSAQVSVAAYSDTWPTVLADRQRLRQVLLNLLTNAVKYNQRGGRVDVRSWLVAGDGDDDAVVIAVTDTGIGIDEANVPRLFQPFERLGDRTADIEGVGVGLALSKQLVLAMGGELLVESVVGQGSTFTVRLPAGTPHSLGPSEVVDDPHVAVGHGPTDRHGELVVLSIEDNASNRRLLQRMVDRRPQWRLVQASTGAEGLARLADSAPHLVLLDLHLPDQGGAELLAAVRANPAQARLPVVILSADATPAQITRLLAAGATDYLTKPFDVPTVLAVLDRVAAEQ